jgi:hypothetical protein
MSNLKQATDFDIGSEIYDELYNTIIEEEIDELTEYHIYDFDNFMLYNGNHENSLSLLSEGEGYYIDKVVNEWDEIIVLLDNCEMLNHIEPRKMTKRKITELFLYLVCDQVVNDYVDELNEKEKKN